MHIYCVMNLESGDIFVVDKFAQKNQVGLIAFLSDSLIAIKIAKREKLIYVGMHEAGDYLFLHKGMLIRAPLEIFEYLISLKQFIYQQQVLDVLNNHS